MFTSFVQQHVREQCANTSQENPDKVTSTLPDMAEYIGLCKLHAMTLDIQHVYSPGAFVTVASDGAAFNGMFPKSSLSLGRLKLTHSARCLSHIG